MLAFRAVVAFAAATFAFANPLTARQATNTNAQIGEVLDTLSVQARQHMFTVDTMQANGTATDGTVGTQVQQMITEFNTASSSLSAIPVSAGSDTVQPTNIELSRVFGETLQLVATGLSGLPAQGTVPNFNAMISQLDPTVAATATALNTTLPGALGFVHTLMLDASQFLVDEGAWPETLAVIGF